MVEEAEAAAAGAFVRKEVAEWDDEAKSRARFKALSGQRSDWEPLYCFWRDLIIKTARHLRIFLIHPSRLTRLWFRRRPDGLSPLCLDRVLLEMHRAGDLMLPRPSPSPSPSRLPQILRRALNFLAWDDPPPALTGEYYILVPLLEIFLPSEIRASAAPCCINRARTLSFHRAKSVFSVSFSISNRVELILGNGSFPQTAPIVGSSSQTIQQTPHNHQEHTHKGMERSLEVVENLSENHWTSTCVVTMEKFEEICMRSQEALAVLDYLSARGRAARLLINRPHPIEGVKLCLAPGAASTASTMDYTLLHLTWTAEKLEKQLHLIDQRYQKSRNLALASLREGNKKLALRYTKELKLASQSRERCSALSDQVEKVLQNVMDAESSKKVVEALQSSKRTMQENQTSIEEVELCLQELDENIDALKRLDNALEATTSYGEIHDDDIEEEVNALQMEITSKKNQVPTKVPVDGSWENSKETDALSNALSDLHLKGESPRKPKAGFCSLEAA